MLVQKTLQKVFEMRDVGRGKQVELHQEIAKRRLRTSAPLLIGFGELLGIDQPRSQSEGAEQQFVVDVHAQPVWSMRRETSSKKITGVRIQVNVKPFTGHDSADNLSK